MALHREGVWPHIQAPPRASAISSPLSVLKVAASDRQPVDPEIPEALRRGSARSMASVAALEGGPAFGKSDQLRLTSSSLKPPAFPGNNGPVLCTHATSMVVASDCCSTEIAWLQVSRLSKPPTELTVPLMVMTIRIHMISPSIDLPFRTVSRAAKYSTGSHLGYDGCSKPAPKKR